MDDKEQPSGSKEQKEFTPEAIQVSTAKSSLKRVVLGIGVIALVIVIGVFGYYYFSAVQGNNVKETSAPAQPAAVTILEPGAGEAFEPGETIRIVAVAQAPVTRAGFAVQGGSLVFVEDGSLATDYELPPDVVGRVPLGIAVYGSNPVRKAEVDIILEPDLARLTNILVTDELSIDDPGDKDSLIVQAVMQDGTEYSRYGLSTNLTITSLTPELVTISYDAEQRSVFLKGHDYGRGTVELRTRNGIVKTVSVPIGFPYRRGNLERDDLIDERDYKIIEEAIGKRANIDDPRDLNKDGKIDAKDLEILKNL
ncbi:MAG: hypothetical protein EXS68_03300 [Candidatus Ryanbacteria bacterium]|nr:hypothetical protein [Candidatus Ryanbacteria bacterium]